MALEVRIRKCFPDFQLNVEFQAEEEVFGVLGESGCGKSMTLKCIAGIESPDEGRIVLNGRVLYDSDQRIDLPPGKRNVGYLFQEYALFPNMTVEQNIAIGAGKRKHQVKEYVHRFFLEGLEHKYPSELSGGQRQRTAIARMMITEPELILLDEPFSAIDSYLKWQIEQQLLDWLEKVNVTTLFVSHNRDEIYRLCDRLGILHRGKLEVCGEKRKIFQNPGTVSAAMLTGCKNIAPISLRGAGGRILIRDWRLELTTPEWLQADSIGLRAHDIQMRSCGEHLTGSKESETLQIEAVVERRIETPSGFIYMVRPCGMGTKPLRVEVSREGKRFEHGEDVSLSFSPEKLLWLREQYEK